ncbi:MAG: hypothetical protein PHP52_09740 [Bacteroidales bacterium]|nr:hypothetical protein [Bacteroidales bacterium]MDY0142985.1 hypothetical protein [Bacteroidales bacterium]
MKNIAIICLLLSLCVVSCKKTQEIKPAVYDIEVTSSVDIVLDENDRAYIHPFAQFVEIDGANVLIINVGNGKLSFYDIDTGLKTNEIYTDSTKPFHNYRFINKDSIFVSYYIGNRDEELQNPSSFQLMNYEGETVTVFGYDIDTADVTNKGFNLDYILPPSAFFTMPICENKVLFPTYSIKVGNVGTSEFMENPIPFALMYDLDKQEYVISKHRNFPYVTEGVYYPTSKSVIYASVSGNNKPLYRYNYSSNVFEWDFENDEIITHSLKSRLIDTIMPTEKPTRYSENTLEYYYGLIQYDKCNKLYYAQMYFNDIFYGSPQHGIIIADKNFNYLGEIYNNVHWPCFSNNNLLFDVYPKNDSVITIDYLKIIKTKRDYNQYIDSCRNDLQAKKKAIDDYKARFSAGNNTVVNFLTANVKIDADDYKILTFYVNEGCLGCSDAVYNEIRNNRGFFEETQFYIVASASSKSEAMAELSKYDLQDFKNLVIDSTNVLKRLAGTNGLLNPRITVVKDKMVVLDSIYSARDFEKELIPNMYDAPPVFSGEVVVIIEQ